MSVDSNRAMAKQARTQRMGMLSERAFPAFPPTQARKAVHFGAGNIGRGFIGMLLSGSGYEVCFVARNETQIAMFQQKKQYTVTYAGQVEATEIVKNVTAIHLKHTQEVKASLLQADLLTTAVGAAALSSIAKPIALGIEARLKHTLRPLHVIACENAVKGSTLLKKYVYEHLSAEGRARADRCIFFADSMIDRIVPAQPQDDPLAITVEPFYEWIIDRSQLQGSFHEIQGALYADRLEPYMERKLFTVNTGHCCAAYFGYIDGFGTIQQALGSASLKARVRAVLEETGRMLVRKYGWNAAEHERYIRTTLERFANPAIVDDVTRVARSPLRKLSRGDRLVRPLLQAHELGLETPHLIAAIAAALLYAHPGDPEAVEMQTAIRAKGLSAFIAEHLGIPAKHALHSPVIAACQRLRQTAQSPAAF